MKAVTGQVPQGPDWIGEIKWDGMRVLAIVADGQVTLQSSSGRPATTAFPELTSLSDGIDLPVVLDGEVVALAEGRPSFQLLQRRMHVTNDVEAARRATEVPVVFTVFDLLHLDGHDTFPLPWRQRRQLLEDVLEPEGPWRLSTVHDTPAELFAAIADQGLEGIIAKRADSPYEPGRRSRSWVKVKARRRQEFVVGGWTPGEQSRSPTFGALLLGYHDGDELRFAGRVGTGFDTRELHRLSELLSALATKECPFSPPPDRRLAPGARWLWPETVVEVEFAEWTADGRVRHPAYLGQRVDKDPTTIVMEPDPNVRESKE